MKIVANQVLIFYVDEPIVESDLPSYQTKGNLVFKYQIDGDDLFLEEYYYDPETSIFWITEGLGLDYFVKNFVEHPFEDGKWYTIEGIHGMYIRGDWGFTDDDEEWYYDSVREATKEEIDNA